MSPVWLCDTFFSSQTSRLGNSSEQASCLYATIPQDSLLLQYTAQFTNGEEAKGTLALQVSHKVRAFALFSI